MHTISKSEKESVKSRSRWSGLARTAFAAAVAMGIGSASHAQQTEIIYSTFLDPNKKTDPRAVAQTKMIELFEQQNPDIKIKVQVGVKRDAMARALQARSATPDVLREWRQPETVATGSILELDEYVARDGIDEDDWLLPLEYSRINGKLYGLPQDYRMEFLVYRKSLLEAAGVEVPTTWADVCETGGKLTKTPVVGFAMGIAGATFTFHSLKQLIAESGPYFEGDGRIAFAKEDFIRAAQTIKDLYSTCGATPLQTASMGYNAVHDGLRAGTVAMALFGSNRFKTIQSQGAGDDLGWALTPKFDENGRQQVYGFQIMINKYSEHKEEAWRFVKFMTGAEAHAIQATGGEVVARLSAYEDPFFDTEDGKLLEEWAQIIRTSGATANYTTLGAAFDKIAIDAFQRMVLRDGTPEEAYEEVVTKYEEALNAIQ